MAVAIAAFATTPAAALAQHVVNSAGMWRGVGTVCNDVRPMAIGHVEGGDGCAYEAITVSTGSTVCQTGVTYLCRDGQWVNVGTMCR